MLLLHTTGRRTGRVRVTPLQYVPAGDALVVVAANGGRRQPPRWLANLRADPRVDVQVGGHLRTMRARVVAATERPSFWASVVAVNPRIADAQRRAGRELDLVLLEDAAPR